MLYINFHCVANSKKEVFAINKKNLLQHFFKDPKLRVRITLLGSVSLNVFYILSLVASGIFFRAIWFYALAIYYILLAFIRIYLFRETTKTIPGENLLTEFKKYRFCGELLLFLNLALGVVVFFYVKEHRAVRQNTIHSVIMYSYTLAATLWAVGNVVKYRKYKSPLFSAAKAISLVSASVSLLSLESALTASLGVWQYSDIRTSVASCVGGFMLTFVLGIAVFMIVRANRETARILDKKHIDTIGRK